MDFNIRPFFEADLTSIGLVWMGLSTYPEASGRIHESIFSTYMYVHYKHEYTHTHTHTHIYICAYIYIQAEMVPSAVR